MKLRKRPSFHTRLMGKTGLSLTLCAACLLASFQLLAQSTVIPFEGPFYIHRDGYTVCYDGRSHIPIWVYEHLTKDDLEGPGRRRNNYRQDPSLPEHVRSLRSDYRHSGYARGHLAPAADHKDSQQNMDDTFYLSNMAPQIQNGFNGGAWARLEGWVRDQVDEDTSVHVISGPLFLAEGGRVGERVVAYPVIGGNDVAVATHFYKIVITEELDGSHGYFAFVLPHRSITRPETFWDFQVTLDEAQDKAGIALSAALLPPSP